MLGGMSGGGMGFIFDPQRREQAQDRLLGIMSQAKRELESALPFAMDPVVYDFAINERGTFADVARAPSPASPAHAVEMPPGYYTLTVPQLLKQDVRQLPPGRRAELAAFANDCRAQPAMRGVVQSIFDRLLPHSAPGSGRPEDGSASLQQLLDENGFDRAQHELIRDHLRSGRIGLAQNRLPPNTDVRDAAEDDVFDATGAAAAALPPAFRQAGLEALAAGRVAVVTLAAGIGSRWTQGATARSSKSTWPRAAVSAACAGRPSPTSSPPATSPMPASKITWPGRTTTATPLRRCRLRRPDGPCPGPRGCRRGAPSGCA
jgi:hypothetical protein